MMVVTKMLFINLCPPVTSYIIVFHGDGVVFIYAHARASSEANDVGIAVYAISAPS